MGVATWGQKSWPSLGIFFVCSLQLGLCIGQIASQCGRKDKVQLTLMSFKPQNSESTDAPLPQYECYLGAEDGDANVSSSRPYRTRNLIEPQPSSPDRFTDNSLPANTAAYRVTLDTDNNNAFGVFTCNAIKDARQDTTVFTIFLRSDGYIVQSDERFTKTVSVGDMGVVIDMTVVNDTDIPTVSLFNRDLDIRWRINGSSTVDRIGGGGDFQGVDYTQLSSRGIRVDDEGVYEPHGNLRRNAHNALQRLIVRSCRADRWGPPGCNGICDNCYNGGVCDDETGRCICPPGFMGTNCLTECGANRFGYSCEFQCDYEGNTDCIGRLFCLLDPYGCTCNAGYQNLDCMRGCDSARYGVGCLQQCHCDDGRGRCDRFTGVCDSGRCQDGWSGSNCQIPVDCRQGYFGSDCTEKCLCMNNVACDRDTGECNNGAQCAPGALKPTGSVRCQECSDGFYGESCTEECHCESDACDKATGECVGCCKPQWLETTDSNTCQTGLEGSSFLKVNSGQPTSVRCDTSPSIISTLYRTELSRERDSHVDLGIVKGRTISGQNNQGSLISTTDFTINNVSSTDVFYCLLVSNMAPVAWLDTEFSAYELPVLNDPPTFHRRSNDSVTIRWRAWDAEKDVGDPPVVLYVTYYKEEAADRWMRGSDVAPDEVLEFTASSLKMDVNYTFSVAAVRDGNGGEGPRIPHVTFKTLCGDPAVPTNVQASLTDDNEVEVSWQITPGSVTCSTGITSFTVYAQIEGSSDEPTIIASVGAEMTSYLISEGLEDGVMYTFLVSLTTDEEGAQSKGSEAVLYTPGSSPVTFIVVIIVIVLVLPIVIILILVVVKRHYIRKEPQGKSESDRVDSAVYTNDGVSNETTGYSSLELDPKKATSPSDYQHLHQGHHGEAMSEYEETDMSKCERKVRGLEYEEVGNSQPGRYILPNPSAGPQIKSGMQVEYHDYEEPGDFEHYTGVYINIPDTQHVFSPEPITVSEFQSFMRKDKTQLVEGIVKEFMILPKGRHYTCSVAQQHCLQRNSSQEVLP